MKIHCIRHEPFEGLGSIEDWVKINNYTLTYTLIYSGQHLPEEIDFDLLIIMGGTASVYDTQTYPWILAEQAFIRFAIEKHVKIIGVCLGAQLIASALGARVYPAKQNEIGWFPVRFNITKPGSFPFFPNTEIVFHWHGDTFELPKGAVLLAASELTPNQGFIYGDRIWALQFHLEMTEAGILSIMKAIGGNLTREREYIQTSEQIFSSISFCHRNNQLMVKILDHIKTI